MPTVETFSITTARMSGVGLVRRHLHSLHSTAVGTKWHLDVGFMDCLHIAKDLVDLLKRLAPSLGVEQGENDGAERVR